MEFQLGAAVFGAFAAIGALGAWASGCTFAGAVTLGLAGWGGILAMLLLALAADRTNWPRHGARGGVIVGVLAFFGLLYGFVALLDAISARMCR